MTPESARVGRVLGRAAAAAILVLGAGCQSAGPATDVGGTDLSFTPGAAAPPPRTINDITAILDEQKLADPAAAAAARARADQPLPDTSDADRLAAFYHQRGLAAGEIGRARQEIDDLTAAARWAARGSGHAEHEILFWLSLAEITAGNFSRGIEHARRAIPKVPRYYDAWRVLLQGNLASAYARAGDMDAAETAFREATEAFRESQRWSMFTPAMAIAATQASLAEAEGSLLDAKGRFVEAERLYREAAGIIAGDRILAKTPWLDYVRGRVAQALVRQERLIEAEAEARAALLGVLGKRGRDSAYTADVLGVLTHVIFEQGRFAETERLARAAVEIYRRAGATPDSLLLAVARTWLGAALVAQTRWPEAIVEYDAILVGMAGDPGAYRRYLAGDFGWALALLHTGQPDRALAILAIALDRSQRMGEKYASTAQIRGLIAMAYAAKGDRRRALREFAEAVPVLLTRSLEIDDEAASRRAQDHLLALILSAYIGLLHDIKGTPLEKEAGVDAAAEAFRVADVARGRSVQRAVDASAARAAAGVPALAEIVRQEQDARRDASGLYGALAKMLARPTDQQDPKVVTGVRARAEAARARRQQLMTRIEREFPAYAGLINPAPATVERVRASLRPGETLIAFYVAEDRTFVWALPPGGRVVFAAAPLGARALAADVTALRRALDPAVQTVGDIPDFDVGRAHRLYTLLLDPVAAAWREARSLLVVLHGPLGQLPLALLVTAPASLGPERGLQFARYRGVPWLVRTHAVAALPSVTALVTLRALPPGDPGRRPFAGFGDPHFSVEQARRASRGPGSAEGAATVRGVPIALRNLALQTRDSAKLGMLPRLPETADEVRRIAVALDADPARDVFLGPQANERTVKTLDLSRVRVIIFATHGLVPGDLDGLTQPALALSAPEVANVDGDGLLTMEEILGLRLNADWIVLSACNTASGQGAGAEAVSGLGRAFFYAGARALLVSHWPVETTSALALTTDLFRRQRLDPTLTRARALGQTMNGLIDHGGFVDPRSGQVVFSYAHPIFWAPFTLIGDGGGGSAP